MSDFNDFLRDFEDWQTLTGDVYEITTGQNAAGQPLETETLIQSNLKVNMWVNSSVETDESDKFVDKEKGTILFSDSDINFTPEINMVFRVGTDDYLFEGKDNIAFFGEIWQISYVKDR